jgi:hypothetical protein
VIVFVRHGRVSYGRSVTRHRLGSILTLAALLVAIGGAVSGDRTDWSGGFGYDGRLYGDLAQHFPGAVFGDAGVAPPGVDPTRAGAIDGLDTYYAARVLPSAVVWATLGAVGVERTHSAVVTAFEAWNVAILTLIVFLWCLCARKLRITQRGTVVGAIALALNFGAVKTAPYWPVATDTFAYGLGAVTLYCWLTGRTLWLALATVAAAFTWPLHLYVGAALLAFPRRGTPLALGSVLGYRRRDRRAVANVVTIAAVLGAAVVLAYELHEHWRSYVSGAGLTPPASTEAFGVSVAVSAIFFVVVMLALLPDWSRLELRATVRPLVGGRGLLVIAVVAIPIVVQHAIARHQGLQGSDLLEQSLAYSTIFPGVFLAALIGYYGPILAIGAVGWRHARDATQRLGPGMVIAVAVFVLGSLLTESRKLIAVFPFAVLACVLAAEQMRWRRGFVVGFALASAVVSRIWMPIGHFAFIPTPSGLRDFPAQRFFTSTGIWMSPSMYLVHVAAGIVLLGLALFARDRRSPPEALTRAPAARVASS